MKMIAGSILILASAVFVVAGVQASNIHPLAFACMTCAFVMLLCGVWQLNRGIVYEDDEQRIRLQRMLDEADRKQGSDE